MMSHFTSRVTFLLLILKRTENFLSIIGLSNVADIVPKWILIFTNSKYQTLDF